MGAADLWYGHAPDGGALAAHQGCGLRAPRDHRARSQGQQEPGGDVATRLGFCLAQRWFHARRVWEQGRQAQRGGMQTPHALDKRRSKVIFRKLRWYGLEQPEEISGRCPWSAARIAHSGNCSLFDLVHAQMNVGNIIDISDGLSRGCY